MQLQKIRYGKEGGDKNRERKEKEHVDDPCEEDKLRDILPERVEALLKYLPSFVNSASVVATSNEQANDYDDPQVLRRLRDLGNIESLS